ncbi:MULTISPECIES: DnaJ C-terminal domain-containing protein [unclassified Novosphingobium]|uniref:DnaJ C-terminal domain-containing protein n=1 Tax=unclassified Novosphingobium TaxID=2644732 RepID=UPI0014461618|nr:MULTISPECIES: DnaJ C-terminal domain-containing protein [unclassified Novosphingobium]NKJ42711.1 DnaJ-class molecular chaperone [Novosphingobium sp. SG720]NMN05652.1 DnaJ-class molecular chaperone [Novosphingobium sp. SG919]NMN87988.1 DnaJ-class molecular chaperone [Novosphingobium sp. SG916]
MAADPYSILGVARSASEKDVKSAYRKLAKELHPDHNKDNPKAAERFAEVTRAYDLLSDKDKRAKFDRGEIDADGNPTMPFGGGGFGGGGFRGGQGGFRHDGGFESGDGPDLSDLFEGLFGGRGGMGGMGGMGGGRRPPPPKGANVSYRLQVPFVEAATRAAQRVTLSSGSTIELKLPPGVESGQQMRLAGKGEPGPGGPGDALITIEIAPHPFFVRDGDNIRLDLPITLEEAVNGAKVKVPTADGAVMLTVAPGSSSGRTLRLKGKGFSRKDGERGDQLVTLQIDLPADDADLKARLAGWHDGRNPRARLGA